MGGWGVGVGEGAGGWAGRSIYDFIQMTDCVKTEKVNGRVQI